jgi:CHAT domain-containing protein
MRSLEDHISPQELANLPESPEALASGGPGNRQLLQHLEQCEECAALTELHWKLRTLGNTGAAAGDCPPEAVWLEFAAGLRPEESSSLLAHAAGCSPCAAVLREALFFMEPDLAQPGQFDDAEDSLVNLASSTPAWQRRVAEQMMAASCISPAAPIKRAAPRLTLVQRLVRQPAWISLPLAAALLLAAVLTGVSVWRAQHPSEARLLALAYNRQRTIALRIPGGDPVEMASGTRGATNDLAEPTELLELRLLVQQNLDKTPNSPYWHQILGEVQLLEQDGLAARRNFEIAQTTAENLPNLQSDLAAAWFEIGEKSGTAEAYAEAAELYSKELHAHPANPSLLYYNRALCWERQSLNENALDDLHSALSQEPSAAWRKAIEAEIARLSTHSAVSPTDGYEDALAEATEKLLPHWTDSPEARAKIQQTATLGLKHNDRWLTDWIAAKHDPVSTEADSHLAAAVSAGAAGEAESSLTEAHQALDLYKQTDQYPGLLRARQAETYALQRLGRGSECVKAASTLEQELHTRQYAWMQAQSLLEDANCHWLIADVGPAENTVSASAELSEAADLPLLHIRSLGLQASYLGFRGMTSSSWQLDARTLRRCVLLSCPPIREYQLLYDMVTNAQGLGLYMVAVELMKTAVQLASRSGDVTTHAYALETLGLLTGRTGDYVSSQKAFNSASSLASLGKKAPLSALYQADWQTDRAEILSRQGQHAAAFQLLQQTGAAILASDYHLARIHYLSRLSEVQRSTGHSNEALTNALGAVKEAELSLSTLHSTIERDQWARINAVVYEELIKVRLSRGEDTAALEAWEHFRRAPFVRSVANGAEHKQAPIPSTARALVFARIDQTYVVWLVQPEPLKVLSTAVLTNRSHLQQTAFTFYRLCADRDSSVADVRSVGAYLYDSLLLPFESQFDSGSTVFLDVDHSLALLPFSALTTRRGDWLGSSIQVKFLPAWWTLEPAASFADPAITTSMRALVVSGFLDPSGSPSSEAGEVAHLFPQSVLIEGASANAKTVLDNLKTAEVFHFSGHATSDGGHRLLLASESTAGSITLSPASLASISMHHCRIAVLAACNTTASDPDQIEHLPDLSEAVLLAGANSVVASNWDVDDRSTRSLMLSFYNKVTGGTPPAQALQIAQQSVRSDANWNHPYYWASFELFTN